MLNSDDMPKEIEQIGNLLKIDGVYYHPVVDDESGRQHIIKFRKLSKDQFDKLVVELVKRLKNKIDIEDLLTHSLSNMPVSELRLALRELDKGTEPEQKRGCTELKIGKAVLQIGI